MSDATDCATERPKTLAEVEREHIERTLARHGGNKRAAAADLGISLKTLYNRLNQWAEEKG